MSKSQCYDSASGATTTCAAGFPTWNANTTICSNAVIGVVYNVRYATEESGVTTIDVITAEITYGTLALAVNTLIEQSFQVSYVSVNSGSARVDDLCMSHKIHRPHTPIQCPSLVAQGTLTARPFLREL